MISPPPAPPVRTFKPRRRPLTPARQELFSRLEPVWCVEDVGDRFDPAEEFGRDAPLVLDIGIGFGDALTTMAAADPDVDVVGADVHTPGIASTLARIERFGLRNVRLVHGDALVFLERVSPGTLTGIRIFFPDPWPKSRHRHRRMASEANVERFVAALRPGGWIHLATDIDDYADQMERVCDDRADLRGGVVDRPAGRPITRYEQKGLDEGRVATDLIYRRTD